ncbi:transposase, partial [Enterococcus sp. BWB1-3]|uniref:transposase n=1 Tax=Enterococcus sp. BWB1-3 TaxID=2787713 RepID=UPI0019226CD7
ILGDAGYVGKERANRLSKQGITLLAIPRKSMKEANKIDYSLFKKQRKAIETVFSSLEILGIEGIHAHCIQRIMTRVQLTVLLYNLLLAEAHKEDSETLKFSIGLEKLSA